MIRIKSYEGYLLGLYGAMFVDIVRNCPKLRVDSDRDYKRLLSIVDGGGLRFIFETLPAFGKHFDCALRDQRLIPSGLPHFRGYRRGGAIPRLFKGLLLRVFDDNGVLRSDPDIQCIGFVRQLCFAAKRFRVPCEPSSTWRQVDEFIKIDGEIVSPSLNWDCDDLGLDSSPDLQLVDRVESRPSSNPLFGEECLDARSSSPSYAALESVQRVSDCIVAWFGRFNPTEWSARHGPGAVSDLKDKSWKYDFPNWSDKLEAVFPMCEFGFASLMHWVDHASHPVESQSFFVNNCPPARLLAVPKAYAGPRLIAAEPTSHQWCQQVVRDFLMSKVPTSPIQKSVSFTDQTLNAKLALEASHSESHATIDLSSASDRISCWLVERIFRRSPSLLLAFHSVRTRWIRQEIDEKSPKFVKLRKFSTMGSALTFPVQTILFCCIAIGVLLHSRGMPVRYATIKWASRQVRVFGDDIIVPNDVMAATVEMLEYLGLEVNRNKTFGTGKFRESCGMDAYDGHDVTKVSVLSAPSVSAPDSILSSVDLQRNLLERGWFATSQYVRTTVERLGRFAFRDVAVGSGSIGWYSFAGFDTKGLKSRWNDDLHRREVRVTHPCGGPTRTPTGRNSTLLQYFTEVAGPPILNIERLGRSSLRHPLKLRWVWASAQAE